MELNIECPWCNQHYSIDESFVGQKVECSACEKEFIVRKPKYPVPDSKNETAVPFFEEERINKKTNEDETVGKHNDAPIYCPHCKKENKTKKTYCIFCGKKFEDPRKCPFCNTILTNDAIYCPDCGQRVDINGKELGNSPRKTSSSFGNSPPKSEKKGETLESRFMNMKKGEKIVFISALSLGFILLIVIIIACSNSGRSDYNTASSPAASSSDDGAAEAFMTLLLMGAAQQQNTHQSYKSSKTMPCLRCGGHGYTIINGVPLTCGQCGGKGSIEY